jgi:hypothetical protein
MYLRTTDTYDSGKCCCSVWRDIYIQEIYILSNEAKNRREHRVDGTKGSWTLQEGQNDIFMINNISGEKFKIKLDKI